MQCTTVVLRIKGPDLHTVGKQVTLDTPTATTECIAEAIVNLLPKMWREEQPVRAITVGASNLIKAQYACHQMNFFTTDSEKKHSKRKIQKENAVDMIRDRFGSDSIFTAAVYTDDGIGSILKKR